METINIKAYMNDTSQIEAIKAFMKALKIKFELLEETKYNSDFVSKIQQGDKDLKSKKGRVVSLDELDSLWK